MIDNLNSFIIVSTCNVCLYSSLRHHIFWLKCRRNKNITIKNNIPLCKAVCILNYYDDKFYFYLTCFLHSFGVFFFLYDKEKEKEEALGFLLSLRYVCFF